LKQAPLGPQRYALTARRGSKIKKSDLVKDSVNSRQRRFLEMTDRLIRSNPGPSATNARDEIFLTEKQLASRHQLSVKTLRNARVNGSYIRFVRLGRRTVRYRLSDVLAYEEANLVRATSDRPSDTK
jgi:hypothetical protein